MGPDVFACHHPVPLPQHTHDLLVISLRGLLPCPSSTLHRSRAYSHSAGQAGPLSKGLGPTIVTLTPSTSVSSSLQAITHALRLSAHLCLWPTTIVFMGRTDGEATWLGSLGRRQCLEELDVLGEPAQSEGQNMKPVPLLLASPKPFTWVVSHKMHVKLCSRANQKMHTDDQGRKKRTEGSG